MCEVENSAKNQALTEIVNAEIKRRELKMELEKLKNKIETADNKINDIMVTAMRWQCFIDEVY